MLVHRLIALIRPQNSTLATEVRPATLLGWYWRKAFSATLRGALLAPFLGRAEPPIFIGSGVRIAYKRRMSLGRGASIGSGSIIQAYSSRGIRLGNRVTIRERAWIQCTSHPARPGVGLEVKDGTYIGPNAIIGVGGRVSIGEACQIGANFTVVAENHAIDEAGAPSATEVTRMGVVIGARCWLGHGVTVLDGVELGEGCIVGAGAVVTKSFPDGSKLAGVPARSIN